MAEEKSKVNMEAFYAPNHDVWVLDIRMNKKAESILATFKSDGKKKYDMLNGKTGERHLIKTAFIGKMQDKSEMEQKVLYGLFDVEQFGSGTRHILMPTKKCAEDALPYVRQIFGICASGQMVLDRKIVATLQ